MTNDFIEKPKKFWAGHTNPRANVSGHVRAKNEHYLCKIFGFRVNISTYIQNYYTSYTFIQATRPISNTQQGQPQKLFKSFTNSRNKV